MSVRYLKYSPRESFLFMPSSVLALDTRKYQQQKRFELIFLTNFCPRKFRFLPSLLFRDLLRINECSFEGETFQLIVYDNLKWKFHFFTFFCRDENEPRCSKRKRFSRFGCFHGFSTCSSLCIVAQKQNYDAWKKRKINWNTLIPFRESARFSSVASEFECRSRR